MILDFLQCAGRVPDSVAWRVRTPLVTAAWLTAAACAGPTRDAEADAPGVSVVDSAGVTIVTSTDADPSTPPLWELGDRPVLTIGSSGGADAEQLFRVTDALRLEDGRLLVANSGSAEVRVFGPDGGHLESWGREGDGPGEFRSLARLLAWAGDSVAAWDRRRGRLSVFDGQGRFGRDLGLEGAGGLTSLSVLGRTTGGNLLVSSTAPPDPEQAPGGLARFPVTYALLDAEGTLVSVLAELPGEERVIRFAPPVVEVMRIPYARAPFAVATGHSVVFGTSDRLHLRVHHEDGGLERIARVRRPPRPMTDRIAATAVEVMVSRVPEERQPALRTTYAELPQPDSLPTFSALVTDPLGYIWVRDPVTIEDDLDGRTSPAQPGGWTLLSQDGSVAGRMTTPPGLEVLRVGVDYILGLVEDELGVERVEVWTLERR